MHRLFVAIAVWATIMATHTGFAAAQSDTLIIPGQRIGPVAFGMTYDNVLKAIGRPKDCSNINNGLRYCHFPLFEVTFNAPPLLQVIGIGVGIRGWSTDRGIEVGKSTGNDVLGAYGTHYCNGPTYQGYVNITYPDLGLLVTLTSSNIVSHMSIEAPGTRSC